VVEAKAREEERRKAFARPALASRWEYGNKPKTFEKDGLCGVFGVGGGGGGVGLGWGRQDLGWGPPGP